jgi:multidrug resistance efflux pump
MSAQLNPTNPAQLPQQPPKSPTLVPPPAESDNKPSWRRWALFALGLAVGTLIWRLYDTNQQEQARAALPVVKTVAVREGILHQTVRVSGTTAARNFANVTVPKLTGPEGNRPMTILNLATNGSYVRKGQIVMEIDGQSLQDHVDDVHATVVQAQMDVDKRKAEHALDMENLMQSVRVAKSELDKAALDVKAKELRTAVDQELLQLSYEEAQAKYNQLLKEVELKKQSQASEMKILQYTTDRHTRHRDRHKADLKKFVVYANMDGLAVVQMMWRGSENDSLKVGDIVAPGQVAMKIVDPKSMQVEGSINQAEVSMFRIGEPANITVDAFPGVTLKGKLYSVGALAVTPARQQNFIRTIPVKVAIESFDEKIIPDLSAAAEVLVGTESSRLPLIPRGALSEEDGKYFVYTKQANGFQRKAVEVGAMNQTQAAIKSGINAGEEVALNYTQPTPQTIASR